MLNRGFNTRVPVRLAARLQQTFDPVRDTQAVFRAVVRALSWPGSVVQLPSRPEGAPGNAWVIGIALTFVDHEVSLAVEPGPAAEEVARYIALRTNTELRPAAEADYVLAEAARLDPRLPERLRRGSLAFPDDAATLIVSVPSLDQDGPADLELELTGPGVPAGRTLRLSGVTEAFMASRTEAVDAYPCGIDILFVDGQGRLVALPRTTAVRVREKG